MTTQLENYLNEFETLEVSERDDASYQRLHYLTDRLLDRDPHEVTPFFIDLLNKEKYLTSQGFADLRLPHILKILKSSNDESCLPYLIQLAGDQRVSYYLKDICYAIGHFKTESSRQFLKAHLNIPQLASHCAILLAHFPDPSGEPILLNSFRESLARENFSSDIFIALTCLQNHRMWMDLEAYLRKPISERERYKVCSTLMSLDHSRIIPSLIQCYRYYSLHNDIDYSDAKAISLEGESMILTKAHKDSIPFSEKMCQRILNKLKLYHSDFRVKALIKRKSFV
ncbi:MAG TPA: hypothetical protein ENI73_01270 [Spirochaetes bacterium]|nr:hypothetical protein [Spirochaetota bacterium]